MSKRRFRNTRPRPLEKLTLFENRLVSPLNIADNIYFGEKIEEEKPQVLDRVLDKALSNLSSDDSLENLFTSFRDFGNSKSSSSSLSWGSEYFNEASKQVRDELERMDRVLRGLEPIPPNYDKEEYEEWMEFFPNLCVLGHATGTRSEDVIKSQEDYEEIIAIDPDNFTETPEKNETVDKLKEQVKTAVTNHLYNKIINKNIQPREQNFNRDTNIEIENYLKISPLFESYSKDSIIHRQPSSRSLISSQISSSKWLKEEDSGFDSLPFLMGRYNVKTVSSSRDKLKPPKGILKNTLVLPPIEPSHVRSVSAIPTRASKSLSALSVNSRGRTRLETPIVRNSVTKSKIEDYRR